METVKKYWYIPIIILLTGIAVWFLKPDKVVVPLPDQVMVHKFDSLKYIKTSDSLKVIVDTLKSQLAVKKKQYKDLLSRQKVDIFEVKNLPIPELVSRFEDKTQTFVKVSMLPDSVVIAPIESIRNAVILFTEGDQCYERERSVVVQNELSSNIIRQQDSLISIKDKRIVGLTREFYSSQATIAGLNGALEKERKKVRTRNVILGILSGVAAAGIVVAIVK